MSWRPTCFGWACLLLVMGAPVLIWWNFGEPLLSVTRRVPAQVLIVEAWIGIDALEAAAREFREGNYEYIVATGAMTYDRWSERHWSYAEMAADQLAKDGVPKDRILAAHARAVHRQRTYESALAAWAALREKGIHFSGANIYTIGAHATRSRLVFAKTAPEHTAVGVIAWVPSDHDAEPWWKSSERGEDLMKETVGLVYEALLNSGRGWSGSKATPTTP